MSADSFVFRGGQYELLDWLQNVTFPTEAKFQDVEYAKKAYTSVVQRVLDCGVSGRRCRTIRPITLPCATDNNVLLLCDTAPASNKSTRGYLPREGSVIL